MDKEKTNMLIEKYLDGTTSEIEEQILADYFNKAGADIPDDWKTYRALFTYINAEKDTLRENLRKSETKECPSISSTPRLHISKRRDLLRHTIWITATACALLILTLHLKPATTGNFAVIDGKVYTNRSVVETEALDALQQVSFNEDNDLDALDMMIQ